MRMRLMGQVLASLSLIASSALSASLAHAQSGDAMTDGLVPGGYLRLGGGSVSPVHPSGSLRDWNRGTDMSITWEDWQGGSSGVGLGGFGILFDYGLLPLNQQQFIQDYETPSGRPQSATAKKASIWTIGGNFRVRIPAPFIMPSVSLGFGVVNYSPGTITYTSAGTTGTARQKGRSGAEFTFGAAVDKQIVDRYALFAEATYEYGLTNIGGGIATPGAACVANGCDALKNTSLGTIRGGLRVRLTR